MNDLFISCQESRIENPRSFYGCFYLGPFNSSQSLTVANALRRTLLSELSGIAITSVEIEGAAHEYSTLPGIRDSVLDILLNLKQIVLKSFWVDSVQAQKNSMQPMIGYLQARGPGIVRAADLKLPPSVQCVDPDQYVASLNADGFLNMKIIINRGKNYIIQHPKLPEYGKKENVQFRFVDVIQQKKTNIIKNNRQNTMKNSSTMPLSIDAVFMPVTKVNYIIENHSVKNLNAMHSIQNMPQKDPTQVFPAVDQKQILFAKSGDFAEQQKRFSDTMFSNNVVILEVWTNGSVYPRQAVYEALKILTCLFSQLERMKILNSFFATELTKSNNHTEKIFNKVEYEYEYYTDMQNTFKKSKTETKLLPEAFLNTQKQFEKKYKQEMLDEKELSKIRICTLNISNRSRKLLENAQIETLADLIKNPDRKLTTIKGFGKKCLQEVKEALEKIGLDFISEKCH
uniref:DNA-directed RNA polymerase subunit alpha n=1 Tax=Bracteacoccus aerius TaxID=50041 RepID=A0A140HAP8_9CHLO|nr:alpha subunit of RNA polymerase [Bracteacoccus aerius]AMO01247.1 alpha subunit of RNA polymerase [Bracteacoccus aerius]